ncbi:hypothetical protein ACM6L3_19115 [Paenibacillus larvae]
MEPSFLHNYTDSTLLLILIIVKYIIYSFFCKHKQYLFNVVAVVKFFKKTLVWF